MLLVAVVVLALVAVPLGGGRLLRLADLRVRAFWSLGVALGLKLLVLIFPGVEAFPHAPIHVISYLFGGYFMFANRRQPGFGLIAFGGILNFIAIASNGGVMPASAAAFSSAGLSVAPGTFSNSLPIPDPNLAFLGDIFATPASWPLHNVFSIGDICIVLGIAIAVHRMCGSRLVPSGSGQFMALTSNRDFVRVWAAQGISNLGDWVYSLAVLATVARRGGGPQTLALLLVVQVAPAAVAGILGGPFIDRLHRKKLMIVTDLLRAVAVGSLLLTGTPSVVHMYAVAAFLGLCGAVFQPSLQASIPNMVDRDRIVAANAMVSGTYNMSVMVGPVIGGLLVANLGPKPAFLVNAISFLVSAAFIVRARIPQAPRDDHQESPVRALRDGIQYALVTPLVRGAFIVIAFTMIGSSLRTPLEPLFVMDTLGLKSQALGLVGGAWGLGMLLGSISAPAAARRWRREQLLGVSIGVIGVCVLLASRSTVLSPILMLWVVSGAANGLGSVAYDSMLQERTPDAFRGRVMAASEAVFQGAFMIGVSLSGWFGGTIGVRPTYAISGAMLVLTAVLCRSVLGLRGKHRTGRPSRRTAPAGDVQPGVAIALTGLGIDRGPMSSSHLVPPPRPVAPRAAEKAEPTRRVSATKAVPKRAATTKKAVPKRTAKGSVAGRARSGVE